MRDRFTEVVIAGKWHGSTKARACGFDHAFRIRSNDGRFYNADVETNLVFNSRELAVDWKAPSIQTAKHSLKGQYAPDILNRIVNSYIAHHKAAGSKFFVYYPMMLAHSPLEPPPLQAGVTGAKAIYKTQVEYVDQLVGRVGCLRLMVPLPERNSC